jgi:hypothetical protein
MVMLLQTAQYTIGTAVVQILSPKSNPVQVVLHNATKGGNNYIFFGGSSSVTTSTGMHLDPGDDYQFVLQSGNSLYAIAASEQELHVMWQEL